MHSTDLADGCSSVHLSQHRCANRGSARHDIRFHHTVGSTGPVRCWMGLLDQPYRARYRVHEHVHRPLFENRRIGRASSSQKLLASVLVVAHICMVSVVIMEAVVMVFSVIGLERFAPRKRIATLSPFRCIKRGLKTQGVLSFDGIEAIVCDAQVESEPNKSTEVSQN